VDRVGSARIFGTQNASYFPYGEDKVSNVGNVDGWGFGTYWKDSLSGLSYAMNRYYSSNLGRFTSPDPYAASGGVSDPGSWNRYTYTRGDPANRVDPWGLNDSEAGAPVAQCQINGNWLYGDACEFYLEHLAAGDFGGPSRTTVRANALAAAYAAAAATTSQMQRLLAQKLTSIAGSNCASVLEANGYTMADLQKDAASIDYISLSDSGADLTLGDLVAGAQNPNQTVYNFFYGAARPSGEPPQDGGAIASNIGGTSVVILGPAFFMSMSPGGIVTTSSDNRMNTLWHEFWHAGLGFQHLDAIQQFGISIGAGQDPGIVFDRWLNNDCKNP
jgi:RHS repeat-associated protein